MHILWSALFLRRLLQQSHLPILNFSAFVSMRILVVKWGFLCEDFWFECALLVILNLFQLLLFLSGIPPSLFPPHLILAILLHSPFFNNCRINFGFMSALFEKLFSDTFVLKNSFVCLNFFFFLAEVDASLRDGCYIDCGFVYDWPICVDSFHLLLKAFR